MLKIKLHNELPQWIISSDIAAYHPFTKTIHIRKKLGIRKTISVLIHELLHFLIEEIGQKMSRQDLSNKTHSWIDRRWQ